MSFCHAQPTSLNYLGDQRVKHGHLMVYRKELTFSGVILSGGPDSVYGQGISDYITSLDHLLTFDRRATCGMGPSGRSRGTNSRYMLRVLYLKPCEFLCLMPPRLQEIAWNNGKCVLAGTKREFGHALVKIEKHKGEAVHVDKLFNGLGTELEVYMSHGEFDHPGITKGCWRLNSS